VTTGKYSLLRKVSFWASPAIVLALCGWWYVAHADLVWYASQPYSTLAEAPRTTALNTAALGSALSWILLPLVCLGCWRKIGQSQSTEHSGTWASLFGLLISVWMFHSVLYPTFDLRYLLPALPPMVLFACAGAQNVLHRFPQQSWRAAAVCLMAAAFLASGFTLPQKRSNLALEQVAQMLINEGLSPASPVLVSSDAEGEGAFVAAIAARDRRPNAIVIRASKAFASSTWMGVEYQLLYQDSVSILKALDRFRASRVVIDDSTVEPLPHQEQLKQALASSREWKRTVWGNSGPRGGLILFQRIHDLPEGRPDIEMDMAYSLGKRLVY
jgi:hypothetical protein